MQSTAALANRLEQYVAIHGDDPFVSKTVSKLFSTRLFQLQKELETVQLSIQNLEKAHSKSSDQFLDEYKSGLAGDDMDFIEWFAMIRMRDRLLSERHVLQGRV